VPRTKSQQNRSSKTVAMISKSEVNEVRVSIDEFLGHRFINIREWLMWGDLEEMAPTKKGVTIPVDSFPELKEAVVKLDQELGGSE
jgi:hypothetical protein